MPEQVHEHRHFIPAMGQQRLTGLYDLFGRLAGVSAMHRYLVDRAGIPADADVLEIGCGTGNLALLVKRRQSAATVVGLDPDHLALTNARRKSERHRLDVRFDHGYADELPYPDRSQDRVLSSLMFHHLEEDGKARALSEALRVLRPGGELHLLDFTGGSGSRSRRLPERIRDNADDRIPERLRAAGFVDVTRTGTVSARWRLGSCTTFSGRRPA
ncbi:class I SAM-dependent methyltransferase [Microlunatus speluncae]|uniref:class I SAM-dependent methyltransferase n=1 Tax=Microlunatus speluncae TaxID=2594267 RepID=UPI00126648F9|nr:class I SAM-dependent methyltransferase [Microlunatus speluncae]